MSNYYAQWKAAKDGFFKAEINTADLPPDFVLFLSQGAGLGPALKTFDKAKTYDDKAKAVVAVLRGKDEYDGEILQAMRATSAPAATKALTRLRADLLAVWKAVEADAQPPRPSGRMVQACRLRTYNLASGLKVKFLDIKETKVDVLINIDATLKELIDKKQEGLKVEELAKVAEQELDSVRSAFADTINGIEAKLAKTILDVKERTAKIREANEVLRYYARLVEDRVNTAVAKEWQAYLTRKRYLRDFRLECVAKIVAGIIGLGLAAASIALTFGALWMNIVGIAKALAGIGTAIKNLTEGIDKTYDKLVEDMAHISELNAERDAARKAKERSLKSKSKEAAKEIAAVLLPFTKPLYKTASSVEDRCKQYLGQLAQLEDKANEMVGKLNEGIDQMGKLPDAKMSAEQKALAKDMQASFEKAFADINALHRTCRNGIRFGNNALKAVQKLRKEDSWIAVIPDVGETGQKGISLYSAANFIFQCANAGKALIPT